MSELLTADLSDATKLEIDSEAIKALREESDSTDSVRSVKSPLLLAVEDLSNKIFKSTLTSVITIAIMLSCVGLLVWSAFFRIPDRGELLTLQYQNENKLIQLQELAARLSVEDLSAIDEQIEAEKIRIIDGFPQLSVWINELLEDALDLDLSVSYLVHDAHQSSIESAVEVPLTVTFSQREGSSAPVFSRSMKLISELLSDHWHMDIISAEARGDAQGVDELTATLQVWVANREGFMAEDEVSF